MAKRRNELEIEVDDLVHGWTSVNREEDPAEWAAWFQWRRENLGTVIEPDNFTVPTEFPPATVQAAKEYIDAVRKIRSLIGWSKGAKALTSYPSAWMG